jgi:hypothetical protein
MEWIWLAGAALVGLFVGASLRGRAPQNLQAPMLNELALNMASDRELMLFTFRRELANYMVRLDPVRFFQLYRKARSAEAAIGSADKAEREAQLTIITKKYPMYEDFDLVGTRGHVLYADALSMHSLEDIEEHYLNLVKFHALKLVMMVGSFVVRRRATAILSISKNTFRRSRIRSFGSGSWRRSTSSSLTGAAIA